MSYHDIYRVTIVLIFNRISQKIMNDERIELQKLRSLLPIYASNHHIHHIRHIHRIRHSLRTRPIRRDRDDDDDDGTRQCPGQRPLGPWWNGASVDRIHGDDGADDDDPRIGLQVRGPTARCSFPPQRVPWRPSSSSRRTISVKYKLYCKKLRAAKLHERPELKSALPVASFCVEASLSFLQMLLFGTDWCLQLILPPLI